MTSGRFSFVLVSDRTGSARPGVFERGLAVTDLLAPSFAIQLGDMIEGYTEDLAELDRQWSEVDDMVAGMRTPVHRVPGNHDISAPVMAKVWRERYGDTYRHFRHEDALFCMLDTQDPPPERTAEQLAGTVGFDGSARADPRQGRERLEEMLDWEGQQPARLSDAQLAYFEGVLREHADARWTFLCLHMPLWQGDHPAWARLRAALGDRPYTAFAGHVHNYRHRSVDGRSHIRLGPTGGLWVLRGPAGNFDHVTQVTVTDDGPVVANILLDGVRDIDDEPILPVATAVVPVG